MSCKPPKGERALVGYYNADGKRLFLLTEKSKSDGWFYLYEDIGEGEIKKLGKAHSPPELEEKFKVIEKMFS